tara:strand:+ start:6443 stop:7162 length:720 start_codon:yes stop_codon:yes gene_type:complete
MLQSNLIRFAINLFDKFEQKKIVSFLKQKLNYPIVIFDVGAHHGETIKLMRKNFAIKSIHSFEASPKNYQTMLQKINNLELARDVFVNNIGLGDEKKQSSINQVVESSSSTINEINTNSDYLKKKKKILSFFSKNSFSEKMPINIDRADNYIHSNQIEKIDLFKIDVEGYEYYVLLGLGNCFSKIKLIYFEHHYDDMIIKNYKFSDIHELLMKNGFVNIFKSKMIFRKTFEYIYLNTNH